MLPLDVQTAAGPQGRLAGAGPASGVVRAPGAGRSALQAALGLLSGGARSKPLPVGRPGARRGGATAAAATAVATAAPTSAAVEGLVSDTLDFGYARSIEDKYAWGRELGKGGNGVVRVVADRASGEEFACKALRKVLPPDAAASEAKRRSHADAIKREVEVMRRLAGSLQVVKLFDVYEDEDNVYIVQELCRGGELHHRINDRHYSERTVASFMRGVLRTLAQCHSRHILHRDIKPGNFMLLDDSDRSPLKAIDFGLAVPYDPECLPRTDLGLEGTPWYMAPEVLSSQVLPASDVWAAGVMAHQLLTGRLPFDDHSNPVSPSISAVWRSVLCDKVSYNKPWWAGLSDDAKDFVSSLLQRDPAKRPTAKEALKHPWLQGNSSERSSGRAIDGSVVARIQRFASASMFKRSVFQLIAEELLSRPGAAAALAASASAQDLAMLAHDSAAGDLALPASPRAPSLSRPGSGGALSRPGSSGMLSRAGSGGILPSRDGARLQELCGRLHLDQASVDASEAAEALAGMGFRLRPSEAARLAAAMDTSGSGRVRRAAFAASQIDWRGLQSDVGAWVEIARRAFAALDKDADGVISLDEIVDSLRSKLPQEELSATLTQVMEEAGATVGERGIDFEDFLEMLRVGSVDSLDQYDARFDFASPGSIDRLQALLDSSLHGRDGSRHGSRRGSFTAREPPAAPPPPPAANFRFDDPTAVSAGAAAADPCKDHKPAPNFRFDVGGWQEPAQQQQQAAAAWPGLTVGAPPPAPKLAPSASAANGTVRGGGQYDKRHHGAGLYRNLVAGAGGTQHLETVRE